MAINIRSLKERDQSGDQCRWDDNIKIITCATASISQAAALVRIL
jgi:hypothetical protein